MAKKVLIISSSPRKGGNSDLLCDEFMKGAIEAGNEVEKIFLKDKTVHPCTGCSVCSMYGKPCPQKDDGAYYRRLPWLPRLLGRTTGKRDGLWNRCMESRRD